MTPECIDELFVAEVWKEPLQFTAGHHIWLVKREGFRAAMKSECVQAAIRAAKVEGMREAAAMFDDSPNAQMFRERIASDIRQRADQIEREGGKP